MKESIFLPIYLFLSDIDLSGFFSCSITPLLITWLLIIFMEL